MVTGSFSTGIQGSNSSLATQRTLGHPGHMIFKKDFFFSIREVQLYETDTLRDPRTEPDFYSTRFKPGLFQESPEKPSIKYRIQTSRPHPEPPLKCEQKQVFLKGRHINLKMSQVWNLSQEPGVRGERYWRGNSVWRSACCLGATMRRKVPRSGVAHRR